MRLYLIIVSLLLTLKSVAQPYVSVTYSSSTPNVTVAAGDTSVTNGLLNWWKFDENTGSTSANQVAGGAVQTKDTSALWTNGMFSTSAVEYNGGAGVRSLANASGMPGSNICSMSFWMQRHSGATAKPGAFVTAGSGAAFLGFGAVSWTDNLVYCTFGANYGTFTLTSTDTNWHNVFLVYDGNQSGNTARLRAYLDGTAKTLTYTGTIPASISTAATNAIVCYDPQDGYLIGRVDDLRIYGRTNTQAEITTLQSIQ